MPDDPNLTSEPAGDATSAQSANAPPCLSDDPRKLSAMARRTQAADLACRRDLDPDRNADNGDEDRYKFPDPEDPYSSEALSFAAQYTKGMGHNGLGEVSPRSQYRALLDAVQPTDPPQPPSTFEAIPRGPQRGIGPSDPVLPVLRRYVNPQAGVAFTLEAPDAPQAAVFAPGRVIAAPQEPFPTEEPAAEPGDEAATETSAFTAGPFPPAPTLSSTEAAGELAENYEMAMLRDVPFTEFQRLSTDPRVLQAAASLSAFADFRGPKTASSGAIRVTAQTVFRGGNYFRNRRQQINGGELVGPYVSQLLLIGTAIEEGGGPPGQFSAEVRAETDEKGERVIPPDSSAGLVVGRKEGRIQFGLITIDQRVRAVRDGIDFMGDYDVWLDIQNGFMPEARNQFLPTFGPDRDPEGGFRFIYNPRQLANWVHFDQTYQAYYAAAFLLLGMAERADQFGEPLFGEGNPYSNPDRVPSGTPSSRNQEGFSTFGQGHLLALLGEADQRALQAVWYQKWFVQRRLRPEAMAGRVHNTVKDEDPVPRERYNLSPDLLDTEHGQKLLGRVFEANRAMGAKTFLLAQAFPEGSPLHPSYGAGHAVEAGAGATILKAFFHEDLILTDAFDGPPPPGVTKQPALIASADGKTLTDYEGAGRNTPLPLWQEVNKMASNIGVGRNIAGVHFRTDYAASLRMGEYVAVGLLQEQAANFNEDQFFEVTLFDLRVIRIGRNGLTFVRRRPVPQPS